MPSLDMMILGKENSVFLNKRRNLANFAAL